ncbi:MAG TPA: HEAT repeat domain-containing protein [Longimicrobiales bacterium]|nr:HEAT repeat domain-containing protein [Longimicrobiales bacterium]
MAPASGSGHAADLATLERLPALAPAEQAELIRQLILNPSPDVRGPALFVGSAVLSDDQICAYLRESASDVLRNAGLEMLKLRGSRAFDLCTMLLSDRDADVVLQAVLALDHLRDPRALGPLREVLTHANPNVVQAAIVAIGNVGHAASAHDLLPFLGADTWLQFAAIQALGALRAPVAVEPLTRLLPDMILGSLAAESLARIGGTEAFIALASRWLETQEDDAALEFVAHVLEGLGHRPPPVAGLEEAVGARLAGAPGPGRSAAARCLLAMGPGPLDGEALEVLAAESPREPALPACLLSRADLVGSLLGGTGALRRWGFLLAARHPSSVPEAALAAALAQQRGSESLEEIANLLAAMPQESGLGAALLDLYDRLRADTSVRWGPLLRRHRAALRAELGRHPALSRETREVLKVILGEDPAEVAAGIARLAPELRVVAVGHVLDWTEVVQHLPWLAWLREDCERFVPLAAAVAGYSGLEKSLPEVRELLRERRTPDLVRLVARLEDTGSVPTLVELLESEQGLRPFITDCLGSLGGPEAREALRRLAADEEDEELRRLAVTALARCATAEDEPFFRDLVGHPDWQVRLACATVLSRSGKPEDRPALIQLYADPVPLVSRRAAAVLEW